ncbi:MAG: acylneuraminate cytidylyltransferase family protein, partial [Patescibacteria group bacterium]
LGIITARGGSKGIPRKNIKLLAGKPLIAYTIDAAKASGVFDRIIVSTDDAEIADVAKQYGAEVPFMRPSELAGDSTPTLPVLVHALKWLKENESYEPDAVMLLQPTAPLRTPQHIREAAELFTKSGADSVVSMSEVPGHHNPHWQFNLDNEQRISIFTGEAFSDIIKRRQELPKTYTRNGAIYLFKTELLFRVDPTFYGDDVRAYVMDKASSVNIDSPEDFALAGHRLASSIHL